MVKAYLRKSHKGLRGYYVAGQGGECSTQSIDLVKVFVSALVMYKIMCAEELDCSELPEADEELILSLLVNVRHPKIVFFKWRGLGRNRVEVTRYYVWHTLTNTLKCSESLQEMVRDADAMLFGYMSEREKYYTALPAMDTSGYAFVPEMFTDSELNEIKGFFQKVWDNKDNSSDMMPQPPQRLKSVAHPHEHRAVLPTELGPASAPAVPPPPPHMRPESGSKGSHSAPRRLRPVPPPPPPYRQNPGKEGQQVVPARLPVAGATDNVPLNVTQPLNASDLRELLVEDEDDPGSGLGDSWFDQEDLQC